MLFGVLPPASAQNWEAGGAAGFGFYRSVAINGPTSTGRAGFGPRFVLGAVLGKSFAEHLAIEGGISTKTAISKSLDEVRRPTSTAILLLSSVS